jgi:hypothetical protein
MPWDSDERFSADKAQAALALSQGLDRQGLIPQRPESGSMMPSGVGPHGQREPYGRHQSQHHSFPLTFLAIAMWPSEAAPRGLKLCHVVSQQPSSMSRVVISRSQKRHRTWTSCSDRAETVICYGCPNSNCRWSTVSTSAGCRFVCHGCHKRWCDPKCFSSHSTMFRSVVLWSSRLR